MAETQEKLTTLYRITIEVEQDTPNDDAMADLGKALHSGALMSGRAASTSVVHVFSDARSAGNVVWSSRA